MHPTLIALAAAFALATPAPTISVPGPTAGVHTFLSAVARAYGGRAALDRVHAYRLEGRVFSAMRHVEVPTIRVWARPGRFKALVNYDRHPEARVVNGADVWRNEPGGPLEPAAGPMRAAVLLQAARAGVPWTLLEHAADARILPDEPPPAPVKLSVDGQPARLVAIEVALGDGMRLRAWADSLGRIVASQGLLESGAMRTHFETYYYDFRTSGGILFAFRELNWASGVQTGVTTVERVRVDPVLREDEFTPATATDSAGGRPVER